MKTIDVSRIQPLQGATQRFTDPKLGLAGIGQSGFTFYDDTGRVVSSGRVLPDGSLHTTQGFVDHKDLGELLLRLISHESIWKQKTS